MSENDVGPDATLDEIKAERKRLATARGLLTRERNKLASEREQLQALADEIAQQRAELSDELERAENALEALQAQEAEVASLKARVDSAESELASAYAELEALSEQVATFKKKYAKKVAKRLMKELVKSTGKNAGKISKKKLLKILSLSEGKISVVAKRLLATETRKRGIRVDTRAARQRPTQNTLPPTLCSSPSPLVGEGAGG